MDTGLKAYLRLMNAQECPNTKCGDSGGYPVLSRDYETWEQEQCQFCWTVPNSVFNLTKYWENNHATETKQTSK